MFLSHFRPVSDVSLSENNICCILQMPITRRQARKEARKENEVLGSDPRTKVPGADRDALGDDSVVKREEISTTKQTNTSQNSVLEPIQSTNR